MKTVLIVGCSITCGMPENNWINWAQKFAEISHCKVINMALGGASIQFISYLLSKGKEKFNPHYTIVQKTFPYRINFINQEFDVNNHIIEAHPNYYHLDPCLREAGTVLTITPSNAQAMFTKNIPKVKFAKWYFTNFHKEVSEADYRVHSEWLDSNSTFSFDNEYMRDIIGCEEYKLDNEGHLNAKGSSVLAHRVYNDFKRNIHKGLSKRAR